MPILDFHMIDRQSEVDEEIKEVKEPPKENLPKEEVKKYTKEELLRKRRRILDKSIRSLGPNPSKVTKRQLQRLAALEMLLFNVEGDGNCFFRALSMCLTGTEEHHKNYRANVVARMRDYPSVVMGIMGYRTETAVLQRAAELAVVGEWVGDADILAICQLMNLNIAEASTGMVQTFTPMIEGPRPAATIGMALVNGNHYVPIVSMRAYIAKRGFKKQKPNEPPSGGEVEWLRVSMIDMEARLATFADEVNGARD